MSPSPSGPPRHHVRRDRRRAGRGVHGAARPLAAALLLLAGADPVGAASDGAPGPVSRGAVGVSIAIPAAARTSGLEDIVLAPWSDGQPAPRGRATACIHSHTGLYQLTATSARGGGRGFRLQSGNDFVPYAVRWDDGVQGPRPVRLGVALEGLVGDADRLDCGGTRPATVEVDVALEGIRAAPSGRYVDTLTLMVAPQ